MVSMKKTHATRTERLGTLLLVQSQMSEQELKGALAGQAGRLRFKVLALVAIEAVAGIVDE